uniref:Uncharacterized protein n=1 Tax=Aegilops tauschii subsp. strangulata TaxID=200361 RepID=A0A452XJB5_AEGTS
QAIALCPGVAVYWVNRGLCHFRRKDWARVEEDSRRALALDDTSVKVTHTDYHSPFFSSCPRKKGVDLYNVQVSELHLFLLLLLMMQGHYLLGCALLEKEECALAVKEFEKVCSF